MDILTSNKSQRIVLVPSHHTSPIWIHQDQDRRPTSAMSSSSDEGEIRENGAGVPVGVKDSKASTLPQLGTNGVDRQDRRARSSRSPPRDGDYRSRRPRSPRGYKRSREDDREPYSRNGRGGQGSDPRRFRVHYEDAAPPSRSRHAHEDLDRPHSRGRHDEADRASGLRYNDSRDYASSSRYDDRDRDYGRSDKRPRTRSPSPYRSGRGAASGRSDRDRREIDTSSRARPGQHAGAYAKYSAHTAKQVRDDNASRRLPVAQTRDIFKDVAKFEQGATDERMAKDTSHLHLKYEPYPFSPKDELLNHPIAIPRTLSRSRRKRPTQTGRNRSL